MELNDAANADTEVMPVTPPLPSNGAFGPQEMRREPRRKSHKALIITIASIAGVLVVAAAAAFSLGQFFFSTRAGVGVSFAGESVMGKTESELTDLVQSKVDNTAFTVTTQEGATTTASYADLGVSTDVKATVGKLLNAKGTNAFSRVNPFNGSDIALVATSDDAVLQEYLVGALVSKDSQVVNPSVTYDAAANTFTATEGKDGKGVDVEPVRTAIAASYARQPATATVSVDLTEKKSAITLETAQQAASEASERLSRSLVVSNGSAKKFTIPAAKIGEWTKVEADADKGTLTVAYDTDAIEEYLGATLPKELKQEKVDQENLVTPEGTRLLVKVAGVDGVDVTDTAEAVGKVTDALRNNTDVAAEVTTKTVKYETKDTTVPHNFGVANGDPWIRVNLSSQTVTAYRGTTVVKTFLMSSGVATAARQSDTGTFYVWHKTTSQTMRGPGYVTPNVKWVSYYNGDEAFHGAPWNVTGIAQGIPKSHGCINMNLSEAQWIYDFAPIGTKVEVVGSTPTSAVRPVAADTDADTDD